MGTHDSPPSPRPAASCFAGSPDVVVVDDPGVGCTRCDDVAGRDEVLLGRIRRDPSHERCLNLWVVGNTPEGRSDGCGTAG